MTVLDLAATLIFTISKSALTNFPILLKSSISFAVQPLRGIVTNAGVLNLSSLMGQHASTKILKSLRKTLLPTTDVFLLVQENSSISCFVAVEKVKNFYSTSNQCYSKNITNGTEL